MHRKRLVAVVGAAALLAALVGSPADATNPNLAPNSHGRMANGKLLPHVSGGTEVTFADERAQGADLTASSDAPPDGTASALGCSNRGSATNPRVNQDCTARRQAEEQVVVNPIDATNIVAGQNDSRVGFNKCGFDYSFDSGTTWGDGQPGFFQHLNPFTGHTYDAASDPAVTIDGTGIAWYSCVAFDLNSNASGIFAVPSTAALKGAAYANIGAGASKYVVAETADGHTFYDKEFIAADTRAGHHEVYETFTTFIADQKCSTGNNPGAYCSSEIWMAKWDGSAWGAPFDISGSNAQLCVGGNTFDKKLDATACNFDQGSMPIVLSDGSVFVVWNNSNTPTFVNQTLGRRIDTSSGTMGPVVRVGQDDETNVALCDLGRGPEECVASLKVRTNDFPAIASDPTNASHLVTVWQDSRNASSGDYRVIVSESTDGGSTWSDATSGGGTVLHGGSGVAYFEPSVAITRTGTVAVSYYRANAYTGTDGKGTFGYGLQAKPSGGSFGPYTPVSDSQTLPSPETNPTQIGFLGDYSSIAASTASGSNTVYPVWSDTRNSGSGGPDEDVFIKTVNLGS